MKNRLLIIICSVLVTYAQVSAQDQSFVREAEKRALQIIRPVEFTQEIMDQVNFPAEYSNPNFQMLIRQELETVLMKVRQRLLQKLIHHKITYLGTEQYKDSVKTAILARFNKASLTEWASAMAGLEDRHHGHDHFETRGIGDPCTNPDFEMCDFTNWELITGTVPYPSPAPYSFGSPTPTSSYSTISTYGATGSGADQHFIANGGTDGVGGFPMVYPGGTCSAVIGNFTGTGNGAAQIRQTFLVSSADAILTLNYAVVLQDAGHAANEQPYFRMRVYDQFGNSINCAAYEAVAGDGQPGWTGYPGGQYKPWTAVFIPMAAYIGQNVTVEFTVGDCAQGGHYGYAYVDASCTPLSLALSATSVCAGSPITITAPTGADTYLWSTGATSQSISVSTAGTYSVLVTPLTGSACSITLDTTIMAYPNPIAAFISDAPTCVGNPVNFTDQSNPNGSTITQWSWNFGDGGTDAVQNPTHTYAAAGTYNVTLTVTTADGCTHSVNQNITINGSAIADIDPVGPFCVTAPAVTLTASAPGGTWSATCGTCVNASTGSFDPATAGPGTHTITYNITGACPSTGTENILVEEVVINSVVATDVTCFGDNDGTITINATGATQYSINAGGTFQAGGNFTGLGPNTYNILVESAIGCQATATVTIVEPAVLTIVAGVLDNVSCFGMCDGEIAALPNGGTTPYTVNWTGDATGTGLSMSDLCVGNYTATVTDDHGCTAVDAVAVTGPPQLIIVSINTLPEICPGDCQGGITINASGGTGGYQYSITGGAPFQASNNFTNVCAGNYNVVVEDNTGCSVTGVTNIAAPSPLVLVEPVDQTICIGSTATITAGSTGGTGAVTFSWDNGLPDGPTHIVDPAGTTTYNVTATDANGCSVNGDVTITENPPLNVIAQLSQSICPGATANLSAVASGGNGGPYTYVWTNDQNPGTMTGPNQVVSPSVQTNYTVTVNDNCGTPVATDVVTISLYPLPAVTYTADTLQGCTPVMVNFANTTNPGLTGQCYWDFGDGTTSNNCNATHVFTEPGCYNISLTVTTINGCVVDTTINNQICVFPYPVPEFFFNPNPTDVFNPDINFVNATIGGSVYSWDFAGLGTATSVDASFIFPADNGGTYPVCLTATNTYGCVDTICHDIIIAGEFLIYVPNAFTPDGDGTNDIFRPIVQGEVPESFELMIFNRWGEMIFFSNNKHIGWDGTHKATKSKSDVYVWKVKVKSSIDNERKVYMGRVSLLR